MTILGRWCPCFWGEKGHKNLCPTLWALRVWTWRA